MIKKTYLNSPGALSLTNRCPGVCTIIQSLTPGAKGMVYIAVQASKRIYNQTVRILVFALHLTHPKTVTIEYALDVLYYIFHALYTRN